MKLTLVKELAKKAFLKGIQIEKLHQSFTPEMDESLFEQWWKSEKMEQLSKWINDPKNPWNPKYDKKHS